MLIPIRCRNQFCPFYLNRNAPRDTIFRKNSLERHALNDLHSINPLPKKYRPDATSPSTLPHSLANPNGVAHWRSPHQIIFSLDQWLAALPDRHTHNPHNSAYLDTLRRICSSTVTLAIVIHRG